MIAAECRRLEQRDAELTARASSAAAEVVLGVHRQVVEPQEHVLRSPTATGRVLRHREVGLYQLVEGTAPVDRHSRCPAPGDRRPRQHS